MIVFGVLAGLAPAAWGGQPDLPRVGDYLDEGYLDALRRSASPAEAGEADTRLKLPLLVSVQADADGRRIALDYGWREGRLLVVLRRDGRMFRPMAWNSPDAFALRVAPPDRLCLAGQAMPRAHCYRYVEDARRFVTRAALVGRWRDRQGQAYWFSAEGRAHFPGYDFGYALALEQGGQGYDSFRIEESGRAMAFLRRGALMTLFAAPARGGLDVSRPLAVLRREDDGVLVPVVKKAVSHVAVCVGRVAERTVSHSATTRSAMRCRHSART